MQLENWINSIPDKEKKLLITDNVGNVNKLLQRLALSGKIIENLEIISIKESAICVVSQAAAKKNELLFLGQITDEMGAFILESILKKNPENYTFVPPESLCIKTCKEILSNLDLIRLNRTNDTFENTENIKIKELKVLLSAYEEEIEKQGFYDLSRILDIAIADLKSDELLCNSGNVAFFLFQKCSAKETDYLNLAFPNAETIEYEVSAITSEMKFFKAYGLPNEVNHVIEEIKDRDIPLGQVGLLYTNEAYEPYIIGAFGQQNIPVRFITGRSAAGLNTIQFMLKILGWAERGFLYKDLKPIMLSPIIRIEKKDDEEHKFIGAFYEFLGGISDGIGWGLERYRRFVDRFREDEEAFVGFNGHSEEYVSFIDELIGIFETLIKEKPIDVSGMLETLVTFTRKYTSKSNEEQKYIKSLLRDEIKNLRYADEVSSLSEAIRLLIDVLEDISVSDEVDENEVAAYCIHGTTVLTRKYQFVIGLADKQFSRSMAESPVLLDEERENNFDFSVGNIPLAKERAILKNDYFFKSFSSLRGGELNLGYSVFNTIDLIPQAPTALYLNLLEISDTDDSQITYMEYPNIVTDKSLVDSDTVYEDAETEEENTEGANAEGIKEYHLSFSTSALDMLMSCPLQYHYSYERKIPSEQYILPEDGAWLPANERGNLMHAILEDYVKEKFIDAKTVAKTLDEKTFKDIANKRVEEMKIKVPSDSDHLVKKESGDIVEGCRQYLVSMHEEFAAPDNKWKVLGCERKFGFGEDPGYTTQCTSVMPGDRLAKFFLSFHGIIDRLDGYEDESGAMHYRIIDYKSGRKQSFEDNKLTVTTQHSVYSSYVSTLGLVEEFKYVFPLDEGELNASTGMFNSVAFGDSFVKLFIKKEYTANPKACEYCEYVDLCEKGGNL